MNLRCYQKEGCIEIYNALHNPNYKGILGIAPTGTGKTVMINSILKKIHLKYPNKKSMVVTHDKTIIGQNEASMKKVWSNADTGIYSAGLNRRDTDNSIIYAGIQSVYKRPHEFGNVAIVFVDEAHMLSPNDGTMYEKFIGGLRKVNPKNKLVLLSATPYRLGQGHLIDSKWADHIAFDYTSTHKFLWFVEQGYLAPLVTKKAAVEIDITDCKMVGGEFDSRALQKLSNTEENNMAVVQECIRYGHNRKHWMVFATGVQHSVDLAEMFMAHGVSAVALHADSPDREKELKLWEKGVYKVLVNVGLYTTGYDFPELDLIAITRATQSTALWVQMLGRGTRPVFANIQYNDLNTQQGRLNAIQQSSKQNCLVLDFVGNTRRLGPINAPVIPKPRRKGQAIDNDHAMQKACPSCGTYTHISVMTCEECGFKFPKPDAKTDRVADTAEVMVTKAVDKDLKEVPVITVAYSTGTSRQSGMSYFKVTYHTHMGTFTCFRYPEASHPVPKKLFYQWWWDHLTDQERVFHKDQHSYPYPKTCKEANLRAHKVLRVPSYITADFNTKFRDIKKYRFDEE